MVIVMPDNYRGLTFLQSAMKTSRDDPTAENIFDIAQQSIEANRTPRGTDMNITMPSFTIDSGIAVEKYFKRMGIRAPFEQGGFDKILPDQPLKVSKIKHRATVEVTKDGTVGSAATAIEIVSFFGTTQEPEDIVINKPFIFYIRDSAQNAILFAGKYSNPNQQ